MPQGWVTTGTPAELRAAGFLPGYEVEPLTGLTQLDLRDMAGRGLIEMALASAPNWPTWCRATAYGRQPASGRRRPARCCRGDRGVGRRKEAMKPLQFRSVAQPRAGAS